MNKYMEKLKKLMEREIVRYVIAGGLTTLVNLVSFWVLRAATDLSRSVANVIAIVLAIIFAFFANKIYVFASKPKGIAEVVVEFLSFVGMRLFALVVEVVGTNLLCDSFRYNEFISKILVQVVVLVINYIFSKCFVFKKNKRPVKDVLVDNYLIIASGLILTAFMVGVWVIGDIGPFGGQSLTMVDSLHQYLPFFSDYYDKLTNEGSLFYTWDIGLGSNMLDIIAYYLSCPLNFIVVLFKREHIYIAMCLLISVKIVLSGMTMASYLGHKCRDKHNLLILPFSMAYALSNYVIGYSWNHMWMDCILILPLIMQGFEQMTEDGSKYKLYVLSLFYGLLCNYYICFMICIFLVLEFILTNHKNIYKGAEDTLRFAGTSVMAAMMAAFLLIPAYLGLNTTASATRTFPEWEWYGSIWDMVKQMFVLTEPIKSQGFDGGVNLYCGSFAILLLFIYIFNTRIKWYEKLKNIVLLAILFVSFNNTYLNYIWHGFHDQYGIPNRFSFLFIFLLLTVGFEALSKLDSKQIVPIILGAVVAYVLLVQVNTRAELPENSFKYTGIIFGVYIMFILAISITDKLPRLVFTISLTLLCMTEVVYSGITGYKANGAVDIAQYYGEEAELQAAIDSTREENTSYRSELVATKVVDESVYYNMQGVSLFGSTVSNDLVNAMHGLGFYTGANEFLFDGANPVSASVLGIRYVFRRDGEYMPYDMNYVDSVENVDVYQNDRALSIGFMVNSDLLNWSSSEDNMFQSINYFVEKSTGVAGAFSQIYPQVTGTNSGITITSSGEYSEYYQLSDIDPNIRSFTLSFTITEEENDLYIIPNCNGISKVRIYINGEEQNYARLQYQTYHVGHLVQGTNVQVEYCFNDVIPSNTSARLTVATFNQAAYDEAYARWSDNQLQVMNFEDGYVMGYMDCDEDGLMFTSIPYDEGWTAYVDGEKTELTSVAGAFVALNLTAGAHIVEFKYFPRGLKSGIVLTLLGWLAFAFVINFKGAKKKARKVSGEVSREVAERVAKKGDEAYSETAPERGANRTGEPTESAGDISARRVREVTHKNSEVTAAKVERTREKSTHTSESDKSSVRKNTDMGVNSDKEDALEEALKIAEKISGKK